MSVKKEKLIQKRNSFLDNLCKLDTWIDGSIVRSTRIQSGKEKDFNYLSRSKEGKNRTTYISNKNLKVFRQARKTGEKAREIINSIIEINIQLLKMETTDNEK